MVSKKITVLHLHANNFKFWDLTFYSYSNCIVPVYIWSSFGNCYNLDFLMWSTVYERLYYDITEINTEASVFEMFTLFLARFNSAVLGTPLLSGCPVSDHSGITLLLFLTKKPWCSLPSSSMSTRESAQKTAEILIVKSINDV